MLPRIVTETGDHAPCDTILSQINGADEPHTTFGFFSNNEGNLQYTTWLFLINGITRRSPTPNFTFSTISL
jgi:hypothetical protein